MHEALSITVGGVTHWGNLDINHINKRAEGYKDITVQEGKVVVTFEDGDAKTEVLSQVSGS